MLLHTLAGAPSRPPTRHARLRTSALQTPTNAANLLPMDAVPAATIEGATAAAPAADDDPAAAVRLAAAVGPDALPPGASATEEPSSDAAAEEGSGLQVNAVPRVIVGGAVADAAANDGGPEAAVAQPQAGAESGVAGVDAAAAAGGSVVVAGAGCSVFTISETVVTDELPAVPAQDLAGPILSVAPIGGSESCTGAAAEHLEAFDQPAEETTISENESSAVMVQAEALHAAAAADAAGLQVVEYAGIGSDENGATGPDQKMPAEQMAVGEEVAVWHGPVVRLSQDHEDVGS